MCNKIPSNIEPAPTDFRRGDKKGTNIRWETIAKGSFHDMVNSDLKTALELESLFNSVKHTRQRLPEICCKLLQSGPLPEAAHTKLDDCTKIPYKYKSNLFVDLAIIRKQRSHSHEEGPVYTHKNKTIINTILLFHAESAMSCRCWTLMGMDYRTEE